MIIFDYDYDHVIPRVEEVKWIGVRYGSEASIEEDKSIRVLIKVICADGFFYVVTPKDELLFHE